MSSIKKKDPFAMEQSNKYRAVQDQKEACDPNYIVRQYTRPVQLGQLGQFRQKLKEVPIVDYVVPSMQQMANRAIDLRNYFNNNRSVLAQKTGCVSFEDFMDYLSDFSPEHLRDAGFISDVDWKRREDDLKASNKPVEQKEVQDSSVVAEEVKEVKNK